MMVDLTIMDDMMRAWFKKKKKELIVDQDA
jgi:hypothetical protein